MRKHLCGQDFALGLSKTERNSMRIREILSKSILSSSKVYPYVINPYVGCQHACSYCYARYMKRFTGHKEPWGAFVDVKINAPVLLKKEILKKRKATVWMSGTCDPYQPLEKKYNITRECLKLLIVNDWPIVIQTRSPLVLRDLDILKEAKDLKVGFSIPTADDRVRKIFEPAAPPISARIDALEKLHQAGIKTYTMIAPILPGAENLIDLMDGTIDDIIVDRMNYHYADFIYKKYGLQENMSQEYFSSVGKKIKSDCLRLGIECNILF